MEKISKINDVKQNEKYPFIFTISYLPWYNEDVLFLVILGHKYGESVQIGTKFIDHLVVTVTEKELQLAGGHLSIVIPERNTVKGLNIREYNLKGAMC